jgi:hypothetical protein
MRGLDLDEIECFVKAVELKSLTSAAKALKLPKSKIRAKSKILKNVSCMTCQTRSSLGSGTLASALLLSRKNRTGKSACATKNSARR